MTIAVQTTQRHTQRQLLPPLDAWAGKRSSYPREQTVAQLFEEVAVRYPERTALAFGEQALSYGELNRRSNVLARSLVRSGAGRETLVGLCAERSLEMIVGMLAILKCGAAFVPLDASYPAERLSFMLSDTGARIVLTQHSQSSAFHDAAELTKIYLDDAAKNRDAADEQDLKVPASARDLAYVMYTSGSTGRPKGVMVEQRSIVRLVRNTDFAAFGPEEVFLQYAPISFDASTFEIWGALLNGAKLVLMPPHASSLQEIGDTIRKEGVTTLWLTAGLFHLFVDQRLDDLVGLRQLLAGGDTLSAPHVRKFLDRAPNTTLINGYGPTEGTTFTCCHSMRHGDVIPDSVSIGRPIANTSVYLLDEQLQPVPAGEVGELCAGGDGIARGYLNAGELTAAKFVSDPFSPEPDGRMYRTGDLARWLPDGTLQFLGRRDQQVKISGHRIELGEIEAALAQHPSVQQACVVLHTDAAGTKRLAAYVVPRGGASVAAGGLKEFLAAKLPVFMVPAYFVALDELPLTANGKVDRAALPNPQGVSGPVSAQATGNALEEQIAALWREVLGAKSVGLDENFFDIGGDSLLIVSVHAQLQKTAAREIPVTALFEHVTVRSLARYLSTAGETSPQFSAAQEQARKQREAMAKQRAARGTRP